jgi:hypothetical protein
MPVHAQAAIVQHITPSSRHGVLQVETQTGVAEMEAPQKLQL